MHQPRQRQGPLDRGPTRRDREGGRGDTLWSIAASKLGDGARWPEIAKLNGLKDADQIVPGQKLKLPKR
ncbi:LysM peptidoglycan-binding domain-containing protein [Streptomyces rapamycinicus]|uniref:Nucleoid-associated protein YgaU n=1 Tax=Streptomyces rapamycinicus TaxID=1226757 RepID=A0ABR6LVR7_9ACTN|nr:LysM peptidoglycan-binding domain-containing protein [Streptomyces rapamycinicus]MBB4785807.1 nucleoid-associated protein YgaU [Streptomyces rapamycinicus]UTO65960.1 LysM peptidoglycan-binding domain-containing protein [Streptomyces rapamycinicus]UTP33915.1 LysM peptidoglycan-binding domain-containing protein [Streptomyces rapamycinicus NRRL 5491]